MQKQFYIKRLFLLSIFIAGGIFSSEINAAQPRYWHQRASLFKVLPTSPKDIIFLGDSINDGCEWHELFSNPHVKNRGISGDTTLGILERLDTITAGKPHKIFLMIGTCDIARAITPSNISLNVEKIIKIVRAKSPHTKIYLQSVLPVFSKCPAYKTRNPRIKELNSLLELVAKQQNIEYIDLHTAFIKSKQQLTNDGLHLTGKGYLLWKKLLQGKI